MTYFEFIFHLEFFSLNLDSYVDWHLDLQLFKPNSNFETELNFNISKIQIKS